MTELAERSLKYAPDERPTFVVRMPSMVTHPWVHELVGTDNLIMLCNGATGVNIACSKGADWLDGFKKPPASH